MINIQFEVWVLGSWIAIPALILAQTQGWLSGGAAGSAMGFCFLVMMIGLVNTPGVLNDAE